MLRRIAGAMCVLGMAAAQTITPDDPRRLTLTPPAQVLRTGETVEFSVRVTGPDGNPSTGAEVHFMAPDRGASGVFARNAGDTPFIATRTTDEDGRAAASFTANDEAGLYLISVVVGKTDAQASIAVTQGIDAGAPVLEAAAARQAVAEQLGIERPDLQLHGPILAPEGATFGAAGLSTSEYPTQRFRLTRPSWLFWIDDAPRAGFQHPTRFVVLDASDDSPDVNGEGRVTREGWWPTVVLEGPRRFSLLPAIERNAHLGPLEPAEPASLQRAIKGFRFAETPPNPDYCAITVHGPERRGMRLDVAWMRRFFVQNLGVPEDNVFDTRDSEDRIRPMFNSDLDVLVRKVREKGCKKVFFHFSGHGYGGGVNTGDENPGDQLKLESGVAVDALNYTTLADKLKPLSDAGVEFCFIIAACSSGSAISAFQDRGLKGEVITASGSTELAYFNLTEGYFFLADFRKGFEALEAQLGRKPTFAEVRQWILANGDTWTLKATPQLSGITPTLPAYNGPTVTIPDPRAGPTLLRMPLPPGTPTAPVSIRLEIRDPRIARFGGTETVRVTIAPGQTEVSIAVTGLEWGATQYSISATDANLVLYRGTGLIEVGRLFVDPSTSRVLTGGTVAANLVRNRGLLPGEPQGYLIRPADRASAEIADILGDGRGVIPPGISRFPFAIRGLAPGTATFDVIDPATGAAVSKFQVVVEGLITERQTTSTVGVSQTVRVRLTETLVPTAAPKVLTIRPVDAESASVAAVPPAVTIAQGQSEGNIPVTPLKPGTATFEVTDPATGATWRFQVVVQPRQVSCLPPGTYEAPTQFVVLRDPASHQRNVGLPNGTFLITLQGNRTVTVRGQGVLTPTFSGVLEPDTCLVDAIGSLRLSTGATTPVRAHFLLRPGEFSGRLVAGPNGELGGRTFFDTGSFLQQFPTQRLETQRSRLFLTDSSKSRLKKRRRRRQIVTIGASGPGNSLPAFPSDLPPAGDGPNGQILIIPELYTPPPVIENPNYQHVAPVEAALRFEPDPRAANRYLARGAGYAVALSGSETTFVLPGPRPSAIRLRMEGGASRPAVRPLDRTAGVSRYFLGSSSTAAPHYRRVRYEAVYPGIDMEFYGAGRQVEYDLIVAPGADPSRISLHFDGVRALEIDAAGDAHLRASGGDLIMRRPRVWQDRGGRRVEIAARYERRSGNRLAFALGDWDRAHPLVIDPLVDLAAYLGGTGADIGQDVALDEFDNLYVAGFTASAAFPGLGTGAQNRGGFDVFVSKLDGASLNVLWTAYVGGSGNDLARAIALDSAGAVYVTGTTNSTNFPVTPGAIQAAHGGGTCRTGTQTGPCDDAFLFKLRPDGSGLVYSTYLGGSVADAGRAVGVDGSGSAYVAGYTSSRNFRTTPGSFRPAYRGGGACGSAPAPACNDAFVLKVDAAGTNLLYSTFLNGGDRDEAESLFVDAGGVATVAGLTGSSDFPTTPGSLQTARKGGNCGSGENLAPCTDAFLVSLNSSGSQLNYGTLLGGDDDDRALEVTLDLAGNAYLTGSTRSTNFPVTASAAQRNNAGGQDAFVAVVDAFARTLISATYLGGTGEDRGESVTVGEDGSVFAAGDSLSPNFPGRPAARVGVPVEYQMRATPVQR